MYLGQEINKILPGNVAIGGANMGMVPLFAVMWCPKRTAIWAGYVAADGQELSKALYPDADAGIQAGNVPTVIEATWQSTNTERGKYVATSSSGNFRVPDLNGMSAGTAGAVFLRGDGASSAGTDGVIQLDEFKSHNHAAPADGGTFNRDPYTDIAGSGSIVYNWQETLLDSNRGGAETRPLNVTGCWVIKMFGAVTNVGSANAAQLATDYAALSAGKVNNTEFTGLNQSKAESGYQKLPGGVIMQWGRAAAISGNTVVTFPIVFPNAVFSINGHEAANTGNPSSTIRDNTITTSGFTFNSNAAFPFHWIAYGH